MDNIESNIEDGEAENEDKDKEERKMPPKMKSPKKKASASSAGGTDATEDHLTSAICNVKLRDNNTPLSYSFNNQDSDFVNEFENRGIDN